MKKQGEQRAAWARKQRMGCCWMRHAGVAGSLICHHNRREEKR